MGIPEDIAKIGENPNFIAFMAHAGFTFFYMTILALRGYHLLPVAALLISCAAIKEFWFDLKYEATPVQTWKDSALDFIGYGFGIVVGAWMLPWRVL